MSDPRDQTASQETGASAGQPPEDPDLTVAQTNAGIDDGEVTQISAMSGAFDHPGEIAAEFERELKAGAEPVLEDCLRRVDPMFHDELFPLMLRREFEFRLMSGETIDLKSWLARFPDGALQIATTHKAVTNALAAAVPDGETSAQRTSAGAQAESAALTDDGSTEDDEETLGEQTQIESRPPAGSRPGKTSPGLSPAGPAESTDDELTVEGRYEKKTVLGAGGMGAIWTAFDSRTRRTVAFKEIRTNKLANQQYIARFLNEAQITAQLEHPGIVPVHDVGWQADGAPFYVMRLVSDETLSRRMRVFHKQSVGHADRNLHSTGLLRNFINVCFSLDYAHSRGIIHRDLKPDNVMIGQHGETIIIDWGLARPFRRGKKSSEEQPQSDRSVPDADVEASDTRAGESVDIESFGPDKTPTLTTPLATAGDTEQLDPIERGHVTPTIAGAVMGTLDYMAPEQAQGRLESLDQRADVFALGAILFEILTGETWPRGRMKTSQKIAYVAQGVVPAAREVNADVPRALEAICAKAMRLEIEDRYTTARQLIDDLECWLADKPVSVYADPWTTRCRRWIQRHMTLTATVAATLLVMCIGIYTWGTMEAARLKRTEAYVIGQFEQAEQALAGHEFTDAQKKLSAAIGAVDDEPALAGLTPGLRSMADKVDELLAEDERVHDLLRQIRDTIGRHQAVGSDPILREQTAEDLTRLITEVDEALQRFRHERDLAEAVRQAAMDHWIEIVEPDLERLTEASRTNDLVVQAAETLQEFHSRLESLRYYGTRYPGSSFATDAQQTREQSLRLLRDFVRESGVQPFGENVEGVPASVGPAVAQLTSPADAPSGSFVRFLNQSGRQQLQDDLFELLVRISDVEVAAGTDQTSGNVPTARHAYEWLLVADTLRQPSRPVLIRKRELLGQLEGSEAELDQVNLALQQGPELSITDRCLLGETALHNLRFEEAAGYFNDVLESDTDHLQARFFAGWCALLEDRPGNAQEDFGLCLEQKPEFAAAYVARSLARLKLGEYIAARDDTQRALDLDEDLYVAWVARGDILADQRPYTAAQRLEAVECFTRAAKLRPTYALPLINRGELKRQMAATVLAAKAASLAVPVTQGTSLAQLVADDPDFGDLIRQYPLVALLARQDPAVAKEVGTLLDAAVTDFSDALELESQNSQAYLFRGQARATLRLVDAAREDLMEGIRLGGDDRFKVSCYREIGRVQMQLQDYDSALWSFSRALEITPEDPDLTLLKSLALRRLGRDEDFVKTISRYLEYGQPLSEVFYNRGKSQQKLGLLREAMQDYGRLLDSGGRQFRPEVLNRRGWMYLMYAHQFAEEDFNEAIERQPGNPDNYNGRGYARVLSGNYIAAIADAELAVERVPPQGNGIAVWAIYFNAATIYGKAVAEVARDDSIVETEQAERQDMYVTRAVELLDRSREVTPPQFHGRIRQAIQQESSFAAIRNTDQFKAMLQRFAASE